jgi:hypothetical protein
MSGDDNVIGVGFGDASSHRSHPALRDQLDADGRAPVDALQVINQLRKIFDAVNVMVRRRADERDA